MQNVSSAHQAVEIVYPDMKFPDSLSVAQPRGKVPQVIYSSAGE
jgi:hypothetical protein